MIAQEITSKKKITDLELENGSKFGIIFLQELWHGDCTGNTDTDPARLCGAAEEKAAKIHSVTTILGDYGTRYRYQCSDAANGRYECIAVDPALFEVAAGTKNYLTGGPQNCSKGDTGHFTHQFKFIPTQTYVSLVSTHMNGISATSCRKDQINQLYNTYINDKSKQIIIAGDFNTARWDLSEAGDAFRLTFDDYGIYKLVNTNWLAYQLSNKPTADYLGTSTALDHVFSNFMYFPAGVTDCPVGDLGFFGGTDHKYTACRLVGLFGGGIKTQ